MSTPGALSAWRARRRSAGSRAISRATGWRRQIRGWRRQGARLPSPAMLPPDDLTALAALAERLADRAGEVIRPLFRAGLDADDKPDGSPVTRADRAAEEALRAILAEAPPDHGIVGEELGASNAGADLVWTLDPIDGTKAFVVGKPLFGTLVALLHRGRSVIGVIDQPVTGERWVGVAGRPTRLGARPARAARVRGARGARGSRPQGRSTSRPRISPPSTRSRGAALLSWGGDAYQYGLVASGSLDLVVEAGLKLHDWAALVPVVEGAGGVITDWEGRPPGTGSGGDVRRGGGRAVPRGGAGGAEGVGWAGDERDRRGAGAVAGSPPRASGA